MEGCSHTWKTGEETVLHLVLSLGVLSCRRSVPLCIPGAESGLSSSALPSLGRQQIHDSLERLSFSQTVAYLISVSSLTSFFPLQPRILPGKQLSMSTPSASVKDWVVLSWTDSGRRKSVPWSPLLTTQPSPLFMSCQRDSQILRSDSPTILTLFCSALVANKHIP